ncbi:FXYD domain-containing ion transport regulator 6 isoform X1 [Oncorhynchus clarkii lewisi]|uniref:FXYD domain-containing ion transport regulator 6 isoform X1 n=1 Tax=Oncorhynchus clarkii lewisi TaxID=490388 RepID=UPI0039B8BF28
METIMFFLFSLLVYVAAVADPSAEDGKKEKKEVDPFVYDYHSLRICGLVFGVVLFALGILLILSKSSYFSRKCRCSSNQEKKPKAPGDEEATAETLIVSKAKEPEPEPEPEPEAKAEN